jgi:hypothetical protein
VAGAGVEVLADAAFEAAFGLVMARSGREMWGECVVASAETPLRCAVAAVGVSEGSSAFALAKTAAPRLRIAWVAAVAAAPRALAVRSVPA